jgi:hypothetical protein
MIIERMILFFLLLALVWGQNVSSLDIEAIISIAKGKSFKIFEKFNEIHFPTFSDGVRHEQIVHEFRRNCSSIRSNSNTICRMQQCGDMRRERTRRSPVSGGDSSLA